jgi:hypothetical protein
MRPERLDKFIKIIHLIRAEENSMKQTDDEFILNRQRTDLHSPSGYCQGQEYVDVYTLSPIRLCGAVINQLTNKLRGP